MPLPFLIDVSHTSHSGARTGIQRVTRSLHAALGARALAITHDPHRGGWRTLEAWENENLAGGAVAARRGAHWPLGARLRGRLHRLVAPALPALPGHGGVVVPELFAPAVARALPGLLAEVKGPRVALFHDAIPLKLPELSPAKTVARFPGYLQELLAFDGIAAVSEDSRRALVDYWQWLDIRQPPPVVALPLGIETQPPVAAGEISPPANPPIVLSVGTIEGRKNHFALLEACEQLWGRGEIFSLHLVGLAQAQTGARALARIRELQSAGRPLRYDGAVGDDAVRAAYQACTFTVYPSLMEGFGLPVIESLSQGKPCICSRHGALGETGTGGGCLALNQVEAGPLAEAIATLLHDPNKLATLRDAATARRFRTWRNYADELSAWIFSLGRR